MKRKISFTALSLLFICVFVCSCSGNVNTLPQGTMRVDFIDVGQGDSTLISLPDGQFILIDTGPASAKRALEKHLEDRGVKELAIMILTHPHEDHIGNADDIIKKYDIDTIIMPSADSNHPSYGYFTEELSYHDLDITVPAVGDTYSFGDAMLTVLSPAQSRYDDLNDLSVITKLSYKDIDFILCGDNGIISQSEVLISRADISAQVLKVPHHGSDSSAMPSFINSVMPSYAVISYETGNSYGHPNDFTLELLELTNAQVLETAGGTVTFTTDGKTLTVE